MLDNIRKYKVILASNSPRRKELLGGLDIDFCVRTLPGISEDYPESLDATDIPLYIARKKAEANRPQMAAGELVITADTVVVLGNEVLGKPGNDGEARQMLRKLSGKTHQVITGVCLMTKDKQRSFAVKTDVTFKELADEEIEYYVSTYHPTDKAGAYGIQEWIGCAAIKEINGSFYNVMGLPVQRLYEELKRL